MCLAHGNSLPLRRMDWANLPSCDAVREVAEVPLPWAPSWVVTAASTRAGGTDPLGSERPIKMMCSLWEHNEKVTK